MTTNACDKLVRGIPGLEHWEANGEQTWCVKPAGHKGRHRDQHGYSPAVGDWFFARLQFVVFLAVPVALALAYGGVWWLFLPGGLYALLGLLCWWGWRAESAEAAAAPPIPTLEQTCLSDIWAER